VHKRAGLILGWTAYACKQRFLKGSGNLKNELIRDHYYKLMGWSSDKRCEEIESERSLSILEGMSAYVSRVGCRSHGRRIG